MRYHMTKSEYTAGPNSLQGPGSGILLNLNLNLHFQSIFIDTSIILSKTNDLQMKFFRIKNHKSVCQTETIQQ